MPPEQATRLVVEEGAAVRFEEKLLRFQLAEAAVLGTDATRTRAALEAMAKRPKATTFGTKTIELPERFLDSEFGRCAAVPHRRHTATVCPRLLAARRFSRAAHATHLLITYS